MAHGPHRHGDPAQPAGRCRARGVTTSAEGGDEQDLEVIVVLRDLTAVRASGQLRHARRWRQSGGSRGVADFNNLLTVI